MLVNDGCDISSEIALRWRSLAGSDDKSTLVQVMAWCRQATSHYLSQCWPSSMLPNGVTMPQWVKINCACCDLLLLLSLLSILLLLLFFFCCCCCCYYYYYYYRPHHDVIIIITIAVIIDFIIIIEFQQWILVGNLRRTQNSIMKFIILPELAS